MPSPSLFEGDRLTLPKAIDLSVESLTRYGSRYRHWAIAYSGGKDSSAVVTLVVSLIESGRIPKPDSLAVLYADTRQELPPLHQAAMQMLDALRDRGIDTRVVLPEMDHRFFVYMLGRGVPPPSNTFRWCTPKLKVMSMERELEALRQRHGEKFLMITGVRIGESAARDQRIAISCSKDSGECGQGWFQQSSSAAIADTLAPILHFRVCHVFDWLQFEAPMHGFDTSSVAQVYGMQESDGQEQIALRTGCIGCPLVQEDRALENIIAQPQWQYLAPLRRLRELYVEVKKPQHRLRQPGGERRKDGQLAKKQNRLGPLTINAREWLRDQVLAIQDSVNRDRPEGAPELSLINNEELARINELIAARTFPDKWSGEEPTGDVLLPEHYQDGSIQGILFQELGV